eukprot:2181480-Prorocentrum_lima.AAC.1
MCIRDSSRIDNEWSGTFSTGSKSKRQWHKVPAVHVFETEEYNAYQGYTAPVDLCDKDQLWECMIEVYANPADRYNKGGSVSKGLMFPAHSCILSAVIFTPYTAKNLAPNTLRIAKHQWSSNQEL